MPSRHSGGARGRYVRNGPQKSARGLSVVPDGRSATHFYSGEHHLASKGHRDHAELKQGASLK